MPIDCIMRPLKKNSSRTLLFSRFRSHFLSCSLLFQEPPWSGLPKHEYFFEILKNGTIVGTIPLDKPFLVVGRLDQCDIVMEHPSLSRYGSGKD